ncbi:MAG: hypothetical protein HYU52_05440 [Acidobacteria bacterium]|nr:hypothetical protein [Acidobacteriota bacterium]
MRPKTLITVVLVLFVVVALGAIVVRTPLSSSAEIRRAESSPAGSERAAAVASAPMATAVAVVAPETEPAVAPLAEDMRPSVAPAAAVTKLAAVSATIEPEAKPEEPARPARKVVATYFHGDVRCITCRKVEAYAREAVEEGFKPQVAAGSVEFRAVNLDVAENAHFVQDFQLTNKSVVVTEEVNGVVGRWAKLDNVWGLVGNRDAYRHYVQDAVQGFLETQ